MAGLASVRDRGSVEQFPDIGLTVVRAPQALHYYSLFSHTVGSDAVLSVYPGNRYEVECKYTQFVMFSSRPVRARLDLQPLAQVRCACRPLLYELQSVLSTLTWHRDVAPLRGRYASLRPSGRSSSGVLTGTAVQR